jgi:hypothetical protein
MKNRGSRQDLEGRLCTETAPAPPVTKPARPPRRPPPVDPHLRSHADDPAVAAGAGGRGHRMIERRRFVLTSLAGVVAEPLAAEAQPAARGIMTRRPSRLLARGRR